MLGLGDHERKTQVMPTPRNVGSTVRNEPE